MYVLRSFYVRFNKSSSAGAIRLIGSNTGRYYTALSQVEVLALFLSFSLSLCHGARTELAADSNRWKKLITCPAVQHET